MPDKDYYEEVIREAGDLDPKRLRGLMSKIEDDAELSERGRAVLTEQIKHLFATLPPLSL